MIPLLALPLIARHGPHGPHGPDGTYTKADLADFVQGSKYGKGVSYVETYSAARALGKAGDLYVTRPDRFDPIMDQIDLSNAYQRLGDGDSDSTVHVHLFALGFQKRYILVFNVEAMSPGSVDFWGTETGSGSEVKLDMGKQSLLLLVGVPTVDADISLGVVGQKGSSKVRVRSIDFYEIEK